MEYRTLPESVREDPEHRTSLAEFFTEKVSDAKKKMEKDGHSPAFVRKVVELTYSFRAELEVHLAGTLADSRMELYGSAIELPGGDRVVPGGGLTDMLDNLVSDLPDDSLKLGEEVTSVSRIDGGGAYKVRTKNEESGAGSQFVAKFVISTLPLGVMKRTNIFEDDVMEPKRAALQNIEEGKLSKVFLYYTQPWWSQGNFGASLAWTQEEKETMSLPKEWYKGVTGFHEVEGHPNYLLAWITGDASPVADNLQDDEVMGDKC